MIETLKEIGFIVLGIIVFIIAVVGCSFVIVIVYTILGVFLFLLAILAILKWIWEFIFGKTDNDYAKPT